MTTRELLAELDNLIISKNEDEIQESKYKIFQAFEKLENEIDYLYRQQAYMSPYEN